jgi:hypothetical protein
VVDEYKSSNRHIYQQCCRISTLLLINIPVGKLFENLDFADEEVRFVCVRAGGWLLFL